MARVRKPRAPRVTAEFVNTLVSAQVATGATTLSNFAPLNPDDLIEGLLFRVRTDIAIGGVAVIDAVVTLAASNYLPPTANAALLGTQIIPTTTFTLTPHYAVAAGDTKVHELTIEVPTMYRAGLEGRYLSLVVTSAAADLTYFASLRLRRPNKRPFAPSF